MHHNAWQPIATQASCDLHDVRHTEPIYIKKICTLSLVMSCFDLGALMTNLVHVRSGKVLKYYFTAEDEQVNRVPAMSFALNLAKPSQTSTLSRNRVPHEL